MALRSPAPSYPTDAEIAQLRTPEKFLVTTLRLWAAPHREPGATHPDWCGGFRFARLPGSAAVAFDTLLRIVATSSMRPLDVRCPKCAHLGSDEGILLQMIGSLQRDRMDEAAGLLAEWVPPSACRIGLRHADDLAAAMQRHDLIIPHRPSAALAAAANHAVRHRGQSHDCTLALVH